jgi:hypothetical protein
MEDAVLPSTPSLVLILIAVALAPFAAAAAGADSAGFETPRVGDGAPRNLEAEAATGDIDAMRAVVQDIVDCLRAKGFHPGDPEVRGSSVLIADWNPGWDSTAGRATEECAFPSR